MAALTLTERVHNLAPELFEKIYEAFITVNEDASVSIDANYKFPIQLHIDRSTRDLFADRYYRCPFKSMISSPASTTSQQEEESDEESDDEEDEDPNLRKWLRAVPAQHRALIRRIEAEETDYSSSLSRPWAHRRVGKMMRLVHGQRYHMPDLVIFASWGAVCNWEGDTVLVRLEGFCLSSWQSHLPLRYPGQKFTWPWVILGSASADILEARCVFIKQATQAAELEA